MIIVLYGVSCQRFPADVTVTPLKWRRGEFERGCARQAPLELRANSRGGLFCPFWRTGERRSRRAPSRRRRAREPLSAASFVYTWVSGARAGPASHSRAGGQPELQDRSLPGPSRRGSLVAAAETRPTAAEKPCAGRYSAHSLSLARSVYLFRGRDAARGCGFCRGPLRPSAKSASARRGGAWSVFAPEDNGEFVFARPKPIPGATRAIAWARMLCWILHRVTRIFLHLKEGLLDR